MENNFKIISISCFSKEYIELVNLISQKWGESVDEINSISPAIVNIFVVTDNDNDNKVVGGTILCVTPKDALCLAYILVNENYFGKGIGTCLMKECIDFACKEHPDKELQLLAEKWNDKTRKFYEKSGFVFRKEIPDYYPDHDRIACLYVYEK